MPPPPPPSNDPIFTDPRRFYSADYVRNLFMVFFGRHPGPQTPQQRAWYDEEWRLFCEQYKGISDIAGNLLKAGMDGASIYAYCQLASQLGGQRVTGMLHILRMLSDAVMNDRSAVPYLIAVARGAQQIPPGVMQGFRWSTGFIALASAIGCIVHISRGDWPRALGDLAKTALGLASAAGAFIDLVFSILDAVVQPVFPGLAKSPFWRLFKTFNPAQTTATAIETVIGLAWCVGVAVKNGDRAFMDEFNKVLERYDRSPLAIWTQAGQGFAVTITMLYPPARNWGFGYATLGSLVDYADQNHTLDSWY